MSPTKFFSKTAKLLQVLSFLILGGQAWSTGSSTGPNIFGGTALPEYIFANGISVTLQVGASESAASTQNPNPSPVAAVWAIITDDDGNEMLRQQLSQVGENDYSKVVSIPAWKESTNRMLTLSYVASDMNGNFSQEIAEASVTQMAYISSLNIVYSHTQPSAAKAAMAGLTLEVSQYPERPASSNWTLHYQDRSGAWMSLPGYYNRSGGASFDVPASALMLGSFDYYFTATDANGTEISVHDAKSPWVLAVNGDPAANRMTALVNPSPTICVRVVSGQSDSFHLKVYDLSGSLVAEESQAVQPGENRICLDQVVSSGVYFAVTTLASQNQRETIKLAIRR